MKYKRDSYPKGDYNGNTVMQETDPEPIKTQEVIWPESITKIFNALIVEGDKQKAYEIALQHCPNIAHCYKPDDGTEIEE